MTSSLETQAQQYLLQRNYAKAATCYEQAITAEPEVKSHYWNLGLLLLLQGEETEAKLTWIMGMNEGEAEEVEKWAIELIEILQQEAARQEILSNYKLAFVIRQHIREIIPSELNNLLHIIRLDIKLENLTGDQLTDLGIIELLPTTENLNIHLLLNTLEILLNYDHIPVSILQFAEACLSQIPDFKLFYNIVAPAAIRINYLFRKTKLAISFLELCLSRDPENIEVLSYLVEFYLAILDYSKAIEMARLCCAYAKSLTDKLLSNKFLVKALLNAPTYWQEVIAVWQEHEILMLYLILEQPTDLLADQVLGIYSVNSFAFYLLDNLPKNRTIQNNLAKLCQINIEKYASQKIQRYQQSSNREPHKLKKIGYLSHCFGSHSVGWLVYWLFKYHNREQFDIHTYFVNYQDTNDPLKKWFINNSTQVYKGGIASGDIAEQIYNDEIDILIDLDSITLDISCEIMSFKPAPVQATWLGWDASGIPTVDYFIADPYVLPASAQDYYTEKIWRLPHTYIAVDGFEVGVPNIRRDTLDIPSDAVVYLSSQRGYKRHPETARLQMKIIKEVPNSYFLLKGFGDSEAMQEFFIQLANEEGVDYSRLRFLPLVTSEHIHRANLVIADVVLDTYPYNGATTTLETLWMGIPLVTKVGEQFAARNSYTMMMNVGVTEGIAWSDEEYLEWGVRLGKDANLRQQVAWKLKDSRQTSPLWNGKQFTCEMEKAYQEMWTLHG